MRTLIISILAVGTSVALVGQQNVAPPVQAKRLPPEKSTRKGTSSNDAYIDRYDFGGQLSALQDPAAVKTGAGPVNADAGSLNRFRCAGRIQTEDRCSAHEDGAGRGSDQREVDGGA